MKIHGQVAFQTKLKARCDKKSAAKKSKEPAAKSSKEKKESLLKLITQVCTENRKERRDLLDGLQ